MKTRFTPDEYLLKQNKWRPSFLDNMLLIHRKGFVKWTV